MFFFFQFKYYLYQETILNLRDLCIEFKLFNHFSIIDFENFRFRWTKRTILCQSDKPFIIIIDLVVFTLNDLNFPRKSILIFCNFHSEKKEIWKNAPSGISVRNNSVFMRLESFSVYSHTRKNYIEKCKIKIVIR